MDHWPTILDIVEEGIQGNKDKCRAYAELWLEKLQADGDTQMAARVQRVLEGRRGKVIHLAEEELGSRLRHAREHAGVKQYAAAEAVGLDATAISKIEHGDRVISALELSQLAALYHTSPDELLKNEARQRTDH